MRKIAITLLAAIFLAHAGCATLEPASGPPPFTHADPDQPEWHRSVFGTTYLANSRKDASQLPRAFE